MATLVSALLVKNEADRYLERVIRRCWEYSDKVLVLNDRSNDNSAALAKKLGCLVRTRSVLHGDAWGKETSARQELWQWMCEEGDWGIVTDADMLLAGDPQVIRALCWSWDAVAWSFVLADLWDSETTYRVDGPWSVGPSVPRPWLFRVGAAPEGWKARWSGRGIHSGHCPANWGELGLVLPAPSDIFWRHLSYLHKADRQRKFRAYRAVSDQLTDFEKMHATSIGD